MASRDELGRYARAENGGAPSFAPSAELPSTRDALLKNATSGPSKAPSFAGSAPQIAPPPDYDKAMHAVMLGHAGADLGHSARQTVSDFAEQFSSHEPGSFPSPPSEGLSAGNMPAAGGEDMSPVMGGTE
jgi:hypothetical protein